MAEYIEREALWKEFEYEPFYDNADRDEIVFPRIDSFPAADVAPVRHGRWEKQSGLYSCSECRKTRPYDVQSDVIEYWACNYCPNCGCRMDGGAD